MLYIPAKLIFEKVKENIKNKHGNSVKLISAEYISSNLPLIFECECGNEFPRSYNKIMQNSCICSDCADQLRSKAYSHSYEYVKNVVESFGCQLVSKEYINNNKKLSLICSCGNPFSKKFSKFQTGQNTCNDCSAKSMYGENHYNYKGGISEIMDLLRLSIHDWKKSIFKNYDYKCAITGTHKNLVVHHLYSFANIVRDSINELGLEVKSKLKDYTDEEYNNLKSLVLSKHTLDTGIVLNRELHSKFHKAYGYGDNTEEQFYKFINDLDE